MAWFSFSNSPWWVTETLDGLEAIKNQANRIERKVDKIMATWVEVKQAWVDYATTLRTENIALRQALEDAQTRAQESADALVAFQADDAATDAQQILDAQQALADELQSTLDSLQNPPPVEPDPLPEEPPVEEPV